MDATKAIRQLCQQITYADSIRLIRTIPGIGETNAAVIFFELQDIRRFKNFDCLCSYVGLIPDTSDSGETKRNRGITQRSNHILRAALVESSWAVIRKDPALLLKYKNYCKHMEKNKAIIRVCKHLLSRINYVLKNHQEYLIGIVA